MKISICCLTCLIGDDNEKDPEESHLISNEQESDKRKSESQEGPAQSATKSEVPVKNDPSLEAQNSEKLRRTVGVSRRYNVKPQGYKFSLGESIEETSLLVKIAIKIIPRSGMAKIYAIDAFNVFYTVVDKSSLNDSVEDCPVVQLRTKIIPSDIRGHSKKYEVSESITGALKFSTECLHTISLQDFQTSSVRLRLYHVNKHQKDSLLGEYLLDNSKLELDYSGSTSNVSLVMHSPSEKDVKPPMMSNVRRSISSSSSGSQSVTRGDFKSTIRRADTKPTSRGALPKFQESSGNDDDGEAATSSGGNDFHKRVKKKKKSFLQTIRKPNAEKELSQESTEEPGTPQKVDKDTALEWLRKGGIERSEKVSELHQATEEMEQTAGNLSAVSVRLREKYEKKNKKKRSLESN